jgi:hypothetical protein
LRRLVSRGHNTDLAVPPRFSRLAVAAAVLGAASNVAQQPARAACSELVYSFQPDCYQPKGDGACGQSAQHLDFGPQVAVWLETSSHALVDTLMVTSLTATRGIGNRPGVWNFRSGPKFPYGKRWMALPLWAFARGRLFDAAVMQDDRETWMGFHEAHSSKEMYFCRPVTTEELNFGVDVVTCPSQNFNSAKGKLVPTVKSYYPPRNDLTTFTNSDCDNVGGTLTTCHVSAASYGALNDLDAIAAATPPYGQPYVRTYHIPQDLPAGDYAIVVEVNKEFDTNDAHNHPAFQDENLPSYGVDGNFGQPSVIYRVPIQLGGSTPSEAATSQIAGYSKWTADAPLDGTIIPRDATISSSIPGSGEMRLRAFDGPGGNGRVHVALQRCEPSPTCGDGGCSDGSAPDALSCTPLPAPPSAVAAVSVDRTDATSAAITFHNASAQGSPVESYEIRYRVGELTAGDFQSADPGPFVTPGAPNAPASFKLDNLKPALTYVVGIRAVDRCGQRSDLTFVSFDTTAQKFTQLSGCFVATAAYGSVLEPEVTTLRRARDRLRAGSPLFAAAADLYYRSGPAAASVVEESRVARNLARRVIGPLAGLAEALDAFSSSPNRPGQAPETAAGTANGTAGRTK